MKKTKGEKILDIIISKLPSDNNQFYTAHKIGTDTFIVKQGKKTRRKR